MSTTNSNHNVVNATLEATAPPESQLSSSIVKAFTSIGRGIFGSPIEIDDRTETFQKGIQYMSERGPNDKDTEKLNSAVVKLLHNPLRTQGATFLNSQRQDKKYRFSRRSESREAILSPSSNQVFKELLESFDWKEHPNGISSLFTALAIIISLSLVRVNVNPDYNETSPFLDLSPLYGANDSETEFIRTKDGRGMLSPDCFFDDRVRLYPAAVSALLILWNRNHNYIAHHLLLNNEGKKWVEPADPVPDPQLVAQDDEIFQIARWINCIHFKKVVEEDFLKVIAGLPNVGPSANLDILSANVSEGGSDHNSSVEFSLLYLSWTSMISLQNLGTLEGDSSDGNESLDTLYLPDDTNQSLNVNRRTRDLVGLKRGPDFRFKDEDLAHVLQNATEQPAGVPRARGTSRHFQAFEEKVIEQARKRCRVCSLNEFRKCLGLKPLQSFLEWNGDMKIANAAEKLYTDINHLELYPGLRGEQAIPDKGAALGYTMTYALLVDLVTIIRSDPSSPKELRARLTDWGYKECTAPLNNGAFGTWLPKLLQRNLPRNYPYDNVYSLFPLTIPQRATTSIGSLKGLSKLPSDIEEAYDFQKPELRTVVSIETLEAIKHVFESSSYTKYSTIYRKDLETLSNGYGYLLGFDDEARHDRDLMMTLFSLIPDKSALSRYGITFGQIAADCIEEASKKFRDANPLELTIDIVRDVINMTCTQWVCQTLCGFRLEKDEGKGTHGWNNNLSTFFSHPLDPDIGLRETVEEMHNRFGALYAYVFRNTDPENGWAIREESVATSKKLTTTIEKNLQTYVPKKLTGLKSFFSRVRSYIDDFGENLLPQHTARAFLLRMMHSNRMRHFKHGIISEHDNIAPKKELDLDHHRITANVLGLAVVTSTQYAQACAQAVDFYLDNKCDKERDEIIRLSTEEGDNPNTNKLIMGYIREAQRIGQPLGLWREAQKDDTILQSHGRPSINVKAGDRIYADFHKAHNDPLNVQDPSKIDPSRPTPSIQGMGFHKCPGINFSEATMPELFKVIFSLKGLRRDMGKAGRLERVFSSPNPLSTAPKMYLDPTGSGQMSYFPQSLSVICDYDASGQDNDEHSDTTKYIFGAIDEQEVKILSSTPPDSTKQRKWTKLQRNRIKRSMKPGETEEAMKHRKTMDKVINVVKVLTLYVLLYWPVLLISSFITPSSPNVLPSPADCSGSTTVFDSWNVRAFVPGLDDQPVAIEYTLNDRRAHRVSIMDIDAKDTRFRFWVDSVYKGDTPDFELNKTVNCDADLYSCSKLKFSGGTLVVPGGEHNVTIEWFGKDYIDGTQKIDWGEQRSRRYMWQREYCA